MSNTWKIYLLTLICFFTGTSEFIVVGILDKIAKTANISIAQAGQLTSVFALTSAIGTPIITYYLRKLNQKRILVIALTLIILGSLILSFAPFFELMIAARIIMALGVGLFNVQCFVVATKLVPPEKRASAISTVTVGFNASLIFGLPLGRVITSFANWQTNFILLAAFCFLSIFMLLKIIPNFEAETQKPFKKQLELFKNSRLLLSMGISFFWIIGYAIFYTFITPFLQNVSAIDNHLLSGTLLAYGVATLIGNKLGAYFSDRFGVFRIVQICMALNIVAIFFLSVETHLPIISIATLMVWSLAVWAPGSLLRYNVLTLTTEDHSIVLSLYNSLVQLGVAVGAGIGGIVVGYSTVGTTIYFSMASTAIGLMIAYRFVKFKSTILINPA